MKKKNPRISKKHLQTKKRKGEFAEDIRYFEEKMKKVKTWQEKKSCELALELLKDSIAKC